MAAAPKMPKALEIKLEPAKDETQRVIAFYKDHGAYGLYEVELPKAVIEKHGKLISKSEPDVFAVLVTHLTKKAREIFGI